MTQVKTIEELRKILDKGAGEFFILMNGGMRSWKTLNYSSKLDKHERNKIEILNEIDESRQVLTEENLFNDNHSIIGKAMKAGAFYYAWT